MKISLRHYNFNVLAATGLSLASLLAPPNAARGAEATVATPSHEESLLIATREAPPATDQNTDETSSSDNDDSLEPVAQSSDRTPELAATTSVKAPKKSGVGVAAQEIGEPTQSLQPSTAPTPIPPSSPVIDDANSNGETLPFEPVKFQGILAGGSTKSDTIAKWGEPTESIATDDGDVLHYNIHPFQAVEVLVGSDDVVSAIKIELATPLEPADLAKQLSLDASRPAIATDNENQPLGQAFPERGVLFMYEASAADSLAGDGNAKLMVSHVVIQPLDAQAFALRVENQLHGPYAENISDLKSALEINPELAHAQYLLATIYLATGQADSAEAAAAEACRIEPENATYQLCLGRTQELLGEYDKSVLTVRAVLDREDIEPIDKAQGLYQMARLAALGDAEIASKAISFHTRAIEVADKLAVSTIAKERRAAKRLLIEAHMAMAEEVARHAYNEKIENLSEWIGRASGLAEEYIANDGGSVELRLAIAQRALGALASFRPTLDPAPWVSEAEEAAQTLLNESNDELWQARIKWELGIAYLNALRVEHVRRETTTALQYGQQAVDNLAEGAASRQAVHASEQMVGLLYFQMGAVYAVHKLDHTKAAQWYDKAEALLTGPRPVSELYSPRREGEMLVSMGVSYWQLGDHARAVDLSQSGVNLVEMAVEDGILPKTTLAIPYGNLATMYRKVGESASAAKYAELAKNVAAHRVVSTPRVGRAPVMRPRSNVLPAGGQQQRGGLK